jgi:hypothetical protein
MHFNRLKCNRGLPCDACTRRGRSSLCSYANNAARNRPASSKTHDLKDRLSSLENLVSSFLSGDAVVQPGLSADGEFSTEDSWIIPSPTDSYNRSAVQSSSISSPNGGDDMLTPETPHIQETGTGQVNYIDPSHWLSILDDIKEVREYLSTNLPMSQNRTAVDLGLGVPDASFLFSSDHNPGLEEILRSLPSQPICDTLLSWYFDSRFMVLGKKPIVFSPVSVD